MSFRTKRILSVIFGVLTCLCIGSFYTWSVFANALCKEWNIASLSILYTVSSGVGLVVAIIGGKINDKIGPRVLAIVSAVLFGVGMFLSGYATNSGFLIVTYSIMTGIGRSTGSVVSTSNTIKLFPDKRGTVAGIMAAAYGISTVILSPVSNALIESIGIYSTFKLLGVIFFVIMLASSFFFFKVPGREEILLELGMEETTTGVSTGAKDKNWKEMLKDIIFYPLFLCFFAGAFIGNMVISQCSQIGQVMICMTPAAAAVAVSILSLFNAAGRIVSGIVSDKIGRFNTLLCAMVLAVAGAVILMFAGNGDVFVFYLGMVLLGVAFGTLMAMFSSIVVDQFGSKNNSLNYSIMAIAYNLSGVVSPMVAASIVEKTGDYMMSYVVAMAAAVLAIVLVLVAKTISKKRTANA